MPLLTASLRSKCASLPRSRFASGTLIAGLLERPSFCLKVVDALELALVPYCGARYALLCLATTSLRRSRLALRLAAGVAAASAGVPGCATQCDRQPNQPAIAYRGGFTNRAAGTYFSADNHGPFLEFPPGRTYRFYHGLGGEPEGHHTDLAFSEYPLDGGGGFVEAAGNQVTYEAANSEYVDVRNDTCSDVWIRVELSDPILSSEPDGAAPRESTADGGDAAFGERSE